MLGFFKCKVASSDNKTNTLIFSYSPLQKSDDGYGLIVTFADITVDINDMKLLLNKLEEIKTIEFIEANSETEHCVVVLSTQEAILKFISDKENCEHIHNIRSIIRRRRRKEHEVAHSSIDLIIQIYQESETLVALSRKCPATPYITPVDAESPLTLVYDENDQKTVRVTHPLDTEFQFDLLLVLGNAEVPDNIQKIITLLSFENNKLQLEQLTELIEYIKELGNDELTSWIRVFQNALLPVSDEEILDIDIDDIEPVTLVFNSSSLLRSEACPDLRQFGQNPVAPVIPSDVTNPGKSPLSLFPRSRTWPDISQLEQNPLLVAVAASAEF